jgi:hypothetical protein
VNVERTTNETRIPSQGVVREYATLSCGIATCILIAASSSAWGAPQLLSPPYYEPTPEALAFDAEDARLNVAYQALAASLNNAERKALRIEERLWIRSRDKGCARGKNYCRRIKTANRADELERRMGGLAAISGEWGYRTDCYFGHYVKLSVPKSASEIVGDWSGDTRVRSFQGTFNGEWRDGRFYVRFCELGEEDGSSPACPKSGDFDGYMVIEGKKLAWFSTVGPRKMQEFQKYLNLSRKPRYGDVPTDSHCDEAAY